MGENFISLYIDVQIKSVAPDLFFLKKLVKVFWKYFFWAIFSHLRIENSDVISGKMRFKSAAK